MKKIINGIVASLLLFVVVGCGETTITIVQDDVISTFTVDLSHAYANPAVTEASVGEGSATVTLNETKMTVAVTGTYKNLTGPATAAHIHGPAAQGSNGAVIVTLTATPDAASSDLGTAAIVVSGSNSGTLKVEATPLTAAQVANMKAGLHYINIHTAANASGEVRGQINATQDVTKTYVVSMSYTNAIPAVTVASVGKGSAVVTLNETKKTVSVLGEYSDLTGPATAAHIHGPAAKGLTGGVVVALTATADPVTTAIVLNPVSKSGKLSLAATTITDVQIANMKAGLHYINIHTDANGSGEVRGQIE